ncbi:uncharacterized protein B0T15DRAFT_541080 [Chaetomium strumarium]|uniref:Arylamine N-acetyltransferase n=1 Tax=Chaetomium strumarium TaxID=1170767 RepID=A0AAJ0GPG7_9PEZI|nr:hypothetical protein B0T15DRAFT_541080 [Chaetomium strumarium]
MPHLYSNDQLRRYFEHIGLGSDFDLAQEPSLSLLTKLQTRHMVRVPFESLSLHYSRHRLLSLDPEDLFKKIVENGRGGYCMEVNAFFATVLRSLGFRLYSAGARVKGPSGYKGWDHMVNIVTINGERYLVDVGFGSNGPTHPIPLHDGVEFDGVPPARGRLQYRKLDEHTDPNQRVWLYAVQAADREDSSSAWRDMYHFVETEFLPEDFEVMNLATMTAPQSFFVQSVMCMCTILDEQEERPVGLLILHRDYVKRRVGGEAGIIELFETEEQRVAALKKYFGIVLSAEEKKAIRGLASEIRSKENHA